MTTKIESLVRTAADLVLAQDQTTNNQHLGYTNEEGSLRAVCNARYRVYDQHSNFGVSQAEWNRCPACDKRAQRLTSDTYVYDRVVEDAAYQAMLVGPEPVLTWL